LAATGSASWKTSLVAPLAIEAVASQTRAQSQIGDVFRRRVEARQIRHHRRGSRRYLAGNDATQLRVVDCRPILVAAEAHEDNPIDVDACGRHDCHGGFGLGLELFGRRRFGDEAGCFRAEALCEGSAGFEVIADENHQISALHGFEPAEVDF
jgi:hypothetical protein